jgi:alpha,alpha-trehalose phosphorylase
VAVEQHPGPVVAHGTRYLHVVIDHHAYPVEPWAVRETALDLEMLGQSESVFALANGHLGLRGNLDEGEPRALSGTYLNGFYESHPIAYGERGFGFPEDGQTIVNVTDGKLIRLLVEDEPLDVHRGRLHDHERVLDLRAGTLERTLRWSSQAGRAVRVTSRRLVSFGNRSVAAISYEVEALEEPLRVALQSNLLANQQDSAGEGDPRAGASLGPALESRLSVHDGLRVVLAHTTRRSGLSLAAGMEHVIETDGTPLTRVESEPDLGRVTISAKLAPGRPLRLVKLLAYHWSSQQSIEWLRDQVDASLENALAEGFDGLAAAQRSALDRYWAVADVELEGDPEIQQALRFARFQILQASARAETRAIAAKGLTGPGYDGHAFWDTESFVLPILTYTAPELARSALAWRHATLDLARERARQLGLHGAALPWRTIGGEECSGYWPAGSAAVHVNADVADAVQRYVFATGDEEFEREVGVELLVETARLWASLGQFDAQERFRIDGVTGPDEYSALVDNNVYTNLMAQANLRSAADAAERHSAVARGLGVTAAEIAAWRTAAEHMHVPYDERLGVHPQDQDFTTHEPWDFDATPPDEYPLLLHRPYFALYRKQVIKQADLVLALYARGDAFTAEQKLRDFDYYERLTVRDSSLSACVQAIVAAEVGHLDLAYDYLAEAVLMDLDDLEHNVLDGVHIASLGGALLAVIAGLGGMRDHGGELAFAPRLPEGLARVAFQVRFRGRVLRLEATPRHASYSLRDGTLHVSHWGERIEVVAGTPVTRPIPSAPRLTAPAQPTGRAPARRART